MTTPIVVLDESCGAAQCFVGAGKDTLKAWGAGNIMSIVNPSVLQAAKATLIEGDEGAITELIIDVMGPVAPIKMADALAPTTLAHKDLAKLVLTLAVRAARRRRTVDTALDVGLAKTMLLNWISQGHFGVQDGEEGSLESRSAQRMSDLISKGVVGNAQNMRLAVIAPLAPAMESLILVSRVSDALLANLAQSYVRQGAQRREPESLLSRVMGTNPFCKAPKAASA